MQLIGRNSIDIDIALDDMLGKFFCEKVNDYLKMIGEETHTVGVIQRLVLQYMRFWYCNTVLSISGLRL
jgi:hypothetical protein